MKSEPRISNCKCNDRRHRLAVTKSSVITFLTIVLAAGWTAALGQQTLTFNSPEELLELLRNGKGPRRNQIDQALGLRLETHQSCRSKSSHGQLEPDTTGIVMRVECDTGDRLVVLEHGTDSRWHYVGSTRLWDATGDELKIELKALVQPPVEEIVVHKNKVMGGTGVLQTDLMIFKVLDHKLQKVFEAVESSNLAQWTQPHHWVDQRSEFEFTTATRDQPAVVDETQTITSDSGKVVLERSFQWSNESDSFDAGLWDSAKVTPKPKAQQSPRVQAPSSVHHQD